METLRSLFGVALGVATLAGQAFAGYTGPDNVVYDYMTINWFHKFVDQRSFNVVESGVMTEEYYVSWTNTTTGIVVLGPNGLEDYSASYDYVDHDIGDNSGQSWYLSNRYSNHYTTAATFTFSRSYERNGSSVDIDTDEDTLPPGLGVSYPTSVTGTTTSGTGWITVTGPNPDPIVGWISYFSDNGPSNYQIEFSTYGEQDWAMITWSNSAPSPLAAPETPEWADEEYEEDIFSYPEIEYPEEP